MVGTPILPTLACKILCRDSRFYAGNGIRVWMKFGVCSVNLADVIIVAFDFQEEEQLQALSSAAGSCFR